jgi:Ca2+-binding RTX toxin-like protein
VNRGVTISLNYGTVDGGSTDHIAGFVNAGGSNQNDIIDGDEADNVLAGYGGDDSISGFGGNDTLDGGTGNDALVGGNGDDLLLGGADADTLSGDAGNDSLAGDTGNDNLSGGEGNDTLDGGANDDTLSGGNANDSLSGGDGNDTLSGGIGDDTVNGGSGDDNLDAGTGNDLLSYAGSTGAVTVDMAAGRATASADTISGFDSVQGSANNDSLVGDSFANGLYGEDGNDTISADGGNDTVLGGNGTDLLAGGDGADSILGGDGVDTLSGGSGNDWLAFGAGDERFTYWTSDSFGNETLLGGTGNDTIDLGIGWSSGPVNTDTIDGLPWINYQRADGTFIYTQSWESVVCFAEGTRIVTPSGEVEVENLRAGDMVLAMRNGQAGFEPLRWVGFMDVAVPRDAAMAAKTAPILIKAGAIAPGMPARDLRVSPDHAMEVDGHLIPAKHLVNGSSIIQESWCRRVRYFHLELEAHGLLLSEGTWSESYLDDGNRHAFNNTELTGLFLDFEAGRSKGQYDNQACLPVLRQGLRLDEIHGRLALRAQELAQSVKVRRPG